MLDLLSIPQEYIFTGQIYVPNKKIMIRGNFVYDGHSSLKGKMKYKCELRDTIEGVLLNNQTYNLPGSENDPKNILMFVHFNQELPNQWFYLTKSGTDFEGKYCGRSEAQGNISSKVKGIDSWRCVELTRYLNYFLNDETLNRIEIDILKKR